MDTAERLNTRGYPIRSKVRKALDQALLKDASAPKELRLALQKAKDLADAWVESLRVEAYGADEETEESDSDADTGAHAEVEPVKPAVRKAVQVTRINAR